MKILAILGVIQGMVLVLFFLTIKKNRTANIALLAGMLLSIIQMLLVVYVGNPLEQNGNIPLKLATWILVFPIPVFFHFYFRILVNGKAGFQKLDFLHLLPTLIAILAVLPYLPFGAKQEAILTNLDLRAFPRQGLYHLFFQSWVIIYYAKLNFFNVENYRHKAMKIYSNLEEKEWKWLQGAATGIFFVGFAGILAALFGLSQLKEIKMDLTQINDYIYMIFGVVSISFYWIGYKAIQQPELFRDFRLSNEKKEKYRHSFLAKENVNRLTEKLVSLMETKELFLNPNLKLSDLANELNTSNKVLSQLINQYFQQNFYDFINTYRIETAKKKLKDPNFEHLSIQGIAIESGFKSKSTFYNLFKKQTGQTPAQFQKKSKG